MLEQAGEDLFVNRSDSSLLSLPIGEHMSVADVDEVAELIRQFFAEVVRRDKLA
jgi:hypothetical protein